MGWTLRRARAMCDVQDVPDAEPRPLELRRARLPGRFSDHEPCTTADTKAR